MLKNAWKGIANWRIKNGQSNCTKFQALVWTIIKSKRKSLNQLENDRKHAHKLPWNACTWPELVDPTFHGLLINLPDQSQNGLKLVTDVWPDWFPRSITQIITVNIVMWGTQTQERNLNPEFEDYKQWVHDESRVLWCRKGLKKAFHTIRQRWRQSQDQERWILCRIETCLLWDRILKKSNEFEFPVSNRTDTMLASFGEPWQKSADSLSLHSQERPQGITSKTGSEHSDENVSSHGNGKPLQGTWNQESSEISGQEYECSAGSGKPVRGTQTQEKKSRPEFRNMKVTNTEYMNTVCQNLQNKLAGIQNLPKFCNGNLHQYVDVGWWCLVSPMKAAIHLNPKHIEYVEVSKNLKFNDIESLFNITKKLIMDNSETRNVSCLDCLSTSWTRSTLLNARAVKLMKAKVHVYSDSVLCLGKIHDPVEAIEPWKGQVATFRVENNSFNELLGMDGEPIEFEWKLFTGFTALEILQKNPERSGGSTHWTRRVQW